MVQSEPYAFGNEFFLDLLRSVRHFVTARAERPGFEPGVPETETPLFESGPFNHSGTSPARARAPSLRSDQGQNFDSSSRILAIHAKFKNLACKNHKWYPNFTAKREISEEDCRDNIFGPNHPYFTPMSIHTPSVIWLTRDCLR